LALYGAATLDCLLGLATLARYRIRQTGILEILLMLVYTLLISVGPAGSGCTRSAPPPKICP
jgi:hypothetical protein